MSAIPVVREEPAEGSEPSRSVDEGLVARAMSFVAGLCGRDHEVSQALEKARAAWARRCRCEEELARARRAVEAAGERATAFEAREEHRAHTVPLGLGVALLVGLAAADAVPLYWAAESFGQGPLTTLVLCGILLVATVAGMWYLERRSHRGLVLAAFAVAYLLLAGLRAHYLGVVDGASPLAAAVEAVGLSAVSALLLAFGTSLLARTQRPAHAGARRSHRRAASAVEAASVRAEEAMREQTHAVELFRHEVERSAFAALPPPGVDSRHWFAALESAIAELVGKGS
jgi:hypothetical protein